MPRYRPSELPKLGVRPKKSLSQNFLIDQNIIDKLLNAADISEGEEVVEIGPGIGAITEALVKRGAIVTAIEKDASLREKLETLPITLHLGDALEFPLERLPSPCKVVANLPFQITSPLLGRLVTRSEQFPSLTLIVQKEVGERITAQPNEKSYSHFSLFVSAYASSTYCFTIKPTSFTPRPKVHSCVVHLKTHPFPYPFGEEPFFTFTKSIFQQKRKTVRASLKGRYGGEWVEKAGLPPNARPGELTLDDFAKLYELIPSE